MYNQHGMTARIFLPKIYWFLKFYLCGIGNNNNLKSYLLLHLCTTSFILIFCLYSLVSTEFLLIYTGASKTTIIPLKLHILQLFTQRGKKGTDRNQSFTHVARDAWDLREFIILNSQGRQSQHSCTRCSKQRYSGQTKKY